MSDVPALASLGHGCCFRPWSRCKHSPGLCIDSSTSGNLSYRPLCIPKYAYPIAIDECRPLQSRANSSAPLGKASEGQSMFWIWFRRSVLIGSGRIYMLWVFLSCCFRGLYVKLFVGRPFLRSIAFMSFFFLPPLTFSLRIYQEKTVIFFFFFSCPNFFSAFSVHRLSFMTGRHTEGV